MGTDTLIEWAHHTFNPWIGCSKVSPGCAHCYAEQLMDHRMGKAKWGEHGTRVRTSESNWKEPLKWNRKAAAQGIRHRVFCASLADVFEVNLQVRDWRNDLFDLIEATPHLDWLLLTKRPKFILDLLPGRWHQKGIPANVWIGTSIENQEQADKRVPELLQVPAAVRFLSCEPLLGPVDIAKYLVPRQRPNPDGYGGDIPVGWTTDLTTIYWVIAGGESGPQARPMHPDWARSLRDQCHAAGVPFLMKQWGEWVVATDHNCAMNNKQFMSGNPGCCWLDINGKIELVSSNGLSSDTRAMIRVGKKAAGRTLDGQIHNAFPEVQE